MYLYFTELFEIELFICTKIDLVLNNLQRLICHKTHCCILTFWPGQKCHSSVVHRKEVTHSNGSYERKSRGQKLADEMGQGEGPTVPLQSDWPEESDLWTAWQLFPLDDD